MRIFQRKPRPASVILGSFTQLVEELEARASLNDSGAEELQEQRDDIDRQILEMNAEKASALRASSRIRELIGS